MQIIILPQEFKDKTEQLKPVWSKLQSASHDIRKAFLNAWFYWETMVPAPLRWAVYGTLVSIAVFGGIHLLGFGSAGVAKGSIAAALHASIGDVPAGSAFAWFQSIGTYSLVRFLALGDVAAVGIGGAAEALKEALSRLQPMKGAGVGIGGMTETVKGASSWLRPMKGKL